VVKRQWNIFLWEENHLFLKISKFGNRRKFPKLFAQKNLLEISRENFFTTLFSFNLGIELGQFLIVIIILPFFLLLREKFKNKIIIFQFIGGLISLLALWWLAERILT